ncbi:MAG: bifunctional phosphoribosylaminoimidazolecarboxamide formyltransferase/IMP cyclohydrolase [Spirochaetaceae bacterium]|nr:bifunctional phosphoribosylaminoimidazolecarboxamide formyltransferase/IMP cyclohydrolase [Spirochaetaceae bacterium]
MKKRGLISVYDKKGVGELASFLVETGWEILSTGGTAKELEKQGLPVVEVASVTGFPECLEGRVKTLHPGIHAGLLAKRGDAAHLETLNQLGYGTIDLVCVNLYPFFEKVKRDLTEAEMIEVIDIGGPALLRSGAKNYQDVIPLTDPEDYGSVISALKTGGLSLSFRKSLAAKVFDLTAAYDAAIARYLLDESYPAYFPVSIKKSRSLRYGENNHQSAALYYHTDKTGAMASMVQLAGKELSYNNVRDLDLAWKTACAFGLSADATPPHGEESVVRLLPDLPQALPACCVAVKHTTPCGLALAATLSEAYTKTYICDPISIFGGILACNVTIDLETAKKMSELFLEIIIAPDFEEDALSLLKKRKDLRIMRAASAPREKLECISIDGGLLVQNTDRTLLEKWDVVTQLQPGPQDIPDMIFGIRAVTYVKSNAIVVVKNQAAMGIGAGETNRLWAAELALNRSTRAVISAAQTGADDGAFPRVLASDAFFTFPDVIEVAAASGIKTIVQPGGSHQDQFLIDVCDKLGIAMVFIGSRHFKH